MNNERALIRKMYFAMSDSIEMLEGYSDVDLIEGEYRANEAMRTLPEFRVLIEQAAKYLQETESAHTS